MKQLYLVSPDRDRPDVEYIPRIFFEARIDFSDVRSGLRETYDLSKAVDISASEGDERWTEDMVLTVDASQVQPTVPRHAKLRTSPELCETALKRAEVCFLEFLLSCFKVKIFRNFALNLYARPGESIEDFSLRCLETSHEPFRREVDSLHEVFQRRLDQIKEKYVNLSDWQEANTTRRISHMKEILHKATERIAQLFLRAELKLDLAEELPRRVQLGALDLEQRLSALEHEARQSVDRLLAAFREKIGSIDEVVVHPNLKGIHLVRTCILWMPAGEH